MPSMRQIEMEVCTELSAWELDPDNPRHIPIPICTRPLRRLLRKTLTIVCVKCDKKWRLNK